MVARVTVLQQKFWLPVVSNCVGTHLDFVRFVHFSLKLVRQTISGYDNNISVDTLGTPEFESYWCSFLFCHFAEWLWTRWPAWATAAQFRIPPRQPEMALVSTALKMAAKMAQPVRAGQLPARIARRANCLSAGCRGKRRRRSCVNISVSLATWLMFSSWRTPLPR